MPNSTTIAFFGATGGRALAALSHTLEAGINARARTYLHFPSFLTSTPLLLISTRSRSYSPNTYGLTPKAGLERSAREFKTRDPARKRQGRRCRAENAY